MEFISEQMIRFGGEKVRLIVGRSDSKAQSGMDFMLKAAKHVYPLCKIDLWKDERGKPRLKIDDEEYGVSVAHSDAMIVAAFSENDILGIDLEVLERRVSQNLRQRISYHNKNFASENSFTTLELWACKEAVLKAKGTGLRYPMRKLRVEKDRNEMLVFTDDKQVYRLHFCRVQKAYLICVALGQFKIKESNN